MDYEGLLTIAADMGYELLRCGAETSRVEDTVYRLVCTYDVRGADVFAVPTCIIVSLTQESGATITKNKRIYARSNNMDRIDRINDLCRRVCADHLPLETVTAGMDEIRANETYPVYMRTIAFALIGFAFTLFFRGNLADAVCGGVIGAIVQLAVSAMERWQANAVFVNIVASGLGAALAVTAVRLGLAQNVDKIVIGVFMNLVPGVALTNAMRDIMAGDYLAGQTRLTEALLTAAAMAVGAGAALAMARLL